MSRAEDIGCLIVCIICLLIGLYAMVDSYLVYLHANDNSLLKYKQTYGANAANQKIKGNMVAWLTIKGTAIDYPVMQGKDNNEYLNKDPYGNYSLSGSIFLDSRNAPDFSDGYSLIYGHHMEGKAMFGELHSFLEKKYFDKHRTGELIVGKNTYKLHMFAALDTDASQEEIFAVTERDTKEVLSYVKEHAKIYDAKVVPKEQKKIHMVGLSTCKAPDSINRVVVFGILEKKQKDKDS